MNLTPSHVRGCLARAVMQPQPSTVVRWTAFYRRLTSPFAAATAGAPISTVELEADGHVGPLTAGPAPYLGMHLRLGDSGFRAERDGVRTALALGDVELVKSPPWSLYFDCVRDQMAPSMPTGSAWY